MEEKFGRGSHQILKTRFYFHKERGLLQKLECTTNGQKATGPAQYYSGWLNV